MKTRPFKCRNGPNIPGATAPTPLATSRTATSRPCWAENSALVMIVAAAPEMSPGAACGCAGALRTQTTRIRNPSIAAGIAYLTSDDAKFVTGSELVSDGGYKAR